MLRLIPIAHPTGHREQYLCSDRDGVPTLSQPHQGFTVLSGQPAHISKTLFAIKGSTPAETWQNWYTKAHPNIPLTVTADSGVPGDVVLHLEDATTHWPTLQHDGWDVWILDEGQNRAALFRAEFSLSCACWLSRHTHHSKTCSASCRNASLVDSLHTKENHEA